MSDYRRLKIWQRARVLSIRIRRMVARLPRHEQFRSGDQIVRAAGSIRHNIADGSSSESSREFARYLAHSIRSADELADELDELYEAGLLPSADVDLLPEPSEIAAMIVSFRRSVLRSGDE